MTNTRFGSGSGSNPGLRADEIRDLVASEVAQTVREAIPVIITAIREQMEAAIDERIAAAIGGPNPTSVFHYKDFSVCSPPLFKGDTSPIVSMRWISDVQGAFFTCGCPDHLRVRYASNLLREGARDWWATWTVDMAPTEVAAITWEDL